MKLLIIEDSNRLRKSLKMGLKRMGYVIDDTGDGNEGLNYALMNDYDVIILDLMLPGLDGISILKELRNKRINTNILILSAKTKIEDRITGLNLGADDYMIKPFSFDELQARLLTLTRRKHGIKSPFINMGEISIDTILKKVTASDVEVALTPTEYLILEYLLLNINHVISYDALNKQIHTDQKFASRNTLEAHISSLRKKLKFMHVTDLVQTKRGFGYYIEQQ